MTICSPVPTGGGGRALIFRRENRVGEAHRLDTVSHTVSELVIKKVYTTADLRTIAKRQKELLIGILIIVLLNMLLFAYRSETVVFLVLIQIVLVLRLAQVLKVKDYWACVLGSLLPGVGFIVLVYVNAQATKCLRANGIRVGFFGAPRLPRE